MHSLSLISLSSQDLAEPVISRLLCYYTNQYSLTMSLSGCKNEVNNKIPMLHKELSGVLFRLLIR